MMFPYKNHLLMLACLLPAIFCQAKGAQATEVKEVVSPGGIKAWLVEEHALPLLAVKVAFRDSGTAYDPKPLLGRSNMTAALLMEGAGELDSRAFNTALEENAIQLNFALDDDMMRASLVTLSQNKDKAFSYLTMALTQPRFDSSALERVRSQSLSLLQQQEREPGYLLHRQWENLIFSGHPYSNPALGTKETISAIGKEELVDYVHRYLARDNMVVAAVGDITPAELGQLLDSGFAHLPEHYAADVTVTDTRIPTEAKQIVIDSDIPQTMLIFGTNGVKREDPDYYAAYVMNHILGGGGLNAKLINEIREKRGLAYSVSSQLDPLVHSGIWMGGFATRNEKVGSALQVLRSALKDYAEKGPTDKELADAKTYLTGSFLLGLDSNADIANYLISMQVYHLGRDYLDKRNRLISGVSKEQVKAAARKIINTDALQVVMVGKPKLDAGQ